jgi:hypothetical protein
VAGLGPPSHSNCALHRRLYLALNGLFTVTYDGGHGQLGMVVSRIFADLDGGTSANMEA